MARAFRPDGPSVEDDDSGKNSSDLMDTEEEWAFAQRNYFQNSVNQAPKRPVEETLSEQNQKYQAFELEVDPDL